ncbi:serine hydrolase [Streptomyces sp. NPDC048350]|uniref:serine hydrolase n=1 Tax=Streptomyces sp. NPDC048350 TaxID=3365538 RepID=UPI003710FBA5
MPPTLGSTPVRFKDHFPHGFRDHFALSARQGHPEGGARDRPPDPAAPAAQGHTSFPTTARLTGARLHGYEWLEGRGPGAVPTDLTEFSPAAYWATGTLVSTTHDLNTFYEALLDGRLLPPRLPAEMRAMSPMNPGRPGRSYGLGLESNGNTCPSDGPVVGHTGEVVGYQTFSFTSADGRRQITLSVNTGLTMTGEAATAAMKVLSTALCRAE